MATIIAASPSRDDVNTAITTAVDGDTVQIPNGSATWTTTITTTKGIKILGETAGSVLITHSAGASTLITMTTHASYRIEVAKINFLIGSGTGKYLQVGGTGQAALVHDCYFRKVNFGAGGIKWTQNAGVIYVNTFESLDADGDGGGSLQIKNESLGTSWTTDSTMGADDTTGELNVYIEDNTFTSIHLQCIDIDDNMRAVIRNNTFNDSGIVGHGADTSTDGQRHTEIYDNTFVFHTTPAGPYNYPLNVNQWMWFRGGTGLMTGNVMPDINSGTWGDKPEIKMSVMNLQQNTGPNPCYGAGDGGASNWPCPHQVGQSHDGATTVTEPIYIWSNTGTGSATPSLANGSGGCTDPDATATYIQSGRDYVNDGTAKPGWTRFTYPHPLRSAAATPSTPTPVLVGAHASIG